MKKKRKKVSDKMYKKMCLLADTLPVPHLRLVNNKWIQQATNHRRQLTRAYANEGKKGVEQYIEAFKAEWKAYQDQFLGQKDETQKAIDKIYPPKAEQTTTHE